MSQLARSNQTLPPDRYRVLRVTVEVVVLAILAVVVGLAFKSQAVFWAVGVGAGVAVVIVEMSVVRRRLHQLDGERDLSVSVRHQRGRPSHLSRALFLGVAFAALGVLIWGALTNSWVLLLIAVVLGVLNLIVRHLQQS